MADVVVDGVYEAQTFATFDHAGREVYVYGPNQGRTGTLVRQGHPVVTQHPELFAPLRLQLQLDDER
jgi:hypothetical protein